MANELTVRQFKTILECVSSSLDKLNDNEVLMMYPDEKKCGVYYAKIGAWGFIDLINIETKGVE